METLEAKVGTQLETLSAQVARLSSEVERLRNQCAQVRPGVDPRAMVEKLLSDRTVLAKMRELFGETATAYADPLGNDEDEEMFYFIVRASVEPDKSSDALISFARWLRQQPGLEDLASVPLAVDPV